MRTRIWEKIAKPVLGYASNLTDVRVLRLCHRLDARLYMRFARLNRVRLRVYERRDDYDFRNPDHLR